MTQTISRNGTQLPGAGLVVALLCVLLVWAVALRFTRPIVRDRDAQIVSAPVPAPELPDARVDPNRASAAELMLLPGVGPALARGIVEDRERNGSFRSIDDLTRVRWIGPAIIARASHFMTIDAVDAPHVVDAMNDE